MREVPPVCPEPPAAGVAPALDVALAPSRTARLWGFAGAAMVLLAFSASLLAYAQDTYYQSHFVFLWVFFAAAIWKAGRAHLRWRVSLASLRDAAGFGAWILALGLLHVGLVTGSSTAQRLALSVTFLAFGLLALRGWGTARCFAYAAFAVLCFGLPYSAYYELTERFRSSFMFLLEALGNTGLFDYRVEGVVLVFPHYRLAITPDCSGFNQLITFLGLAFLGTLTGRPSLRRALLLFCAGAVLAYVSNLFRVLVFVVCVACGQTTVIENENLHAIVGFIAYAPFILAFLWLILRTHRPRAAAAAPAQTRRRLPIGALAVPFLLVWLADHAQPPPSGEPPAYMEGVLAPPGHAVVARAHTEEWESSAYDTPWLVNARFAASDKSGSFELFAYLTRSRGHLAVHQISNCLSVPGFDVVYGPPVVVEGRTFWSVDLIGKGKRYHGYYAFWVDGEDCDDSLATQLRVFAKRLSSGLEEVGLTRFLLQGPLPETPSAYGRALLGWRARQLNAIAPVKKKAR